MDGGSAASWEFLWDMLQLGEFVIRSSAAVVCDSELFSSSAFEHIVASDSIPRHLKRALNAC